VGNPPSTELINVFVSGFSLVLMYNSLPALDAEKQIAEQTVSGLKCAPILREWMDVFFQRKIQFWFDTPWLPFHCLATPTCMAAVTSCKNVL